MKALIVIDAQESFRQRPQWALTSVPDIAERIGRLVGHARAVGDVVVWVLHDEPGSGGVFDPERGFNVLLEGLAPLSGEVVFRKTVHNAFTTTGLAQHLTARGITGLRICGIRTEQCCETTARLASDLGYEVEFVVDATATHPIEHHAAAPGRTLEEILADPRTLGTAEIIERTCYALSGRFAAITTVDDVLAAS